MHITLVTENLRNLYITSANKVQRGQLNNSQKIQMIKPRNEKNITTEHNFI
jgi:hypothetical protein